MFPLIAVACLVSLSQAAPQSSVASRLDGRIVGGEPTFIEEHPYQASLLYYSSHRCGAVIISEDYVVTAAHCTVGTSTPNLSLRVGSSYRNSGGIVKQFAAIYQNPKYNGGLVDYDITVLELASPLSFGSAIAPITLPVLNESFAPGTLSQVTGWGVLTEGGTAASQLQVVDVPLISLEECRAVYGTFIVTDRMLCAGYTEGGKDACQGDSGGPLVVNGTLVGLVSWGWGCAIPNFPGVYASVPALRGYITEITGL